MFPPILKEAIVAPIFKKGKIDDLTNYRPIALLSVFSQIIEKIRKVRLLHFLNRRTVLVLSNTVSRKVKVLRISDFVTTVHTGINKEAL